MLIAGLLPRSSRPVVDTLGPPRTARATWSLVLGLSLLMMIRLWVFESYVFTPELLTRIYAGSLDQMAIAERFQSRQSAVVWAYLMTPLVLVVRVAVVAALAQTTLLLFGREVPFSSTFRSFLFAQGAVVIASLAHVLYLTTIPRSNLNAADLWIPFDSVLNFVGEDRLHPLLASSGELLSVSEALWVVLAVAGLTRLAGVSGKIALSTVMVVWLMSAALRVAITVYAQHLLA